MSPCGMTAGANDGSLGMSQQRVLFRRPIVPIRGMQAQTPGTSEIPPSTGRTAPVTKAPARLER
jgi:hypothetical protein